VQRLILSPTSLHYFFSFSNLSRVFRRLLQRYQNVKSELEAQQNIERIRSDKYKVKYSLFFSKWSKSHHSYRECLRQSHSLFAPL